MEKPATEGGRPARKEFLPIAIPFIGKEEIDEMTDTLKSGWISLGPKTARFEEQFRDYIGAGAAVSVNSCTLGMFLSLVARGIKQGDEVILPPLTFAATANVVIHAGAKPVFADIDPETYNIDSAEIEKKITNKTKAIIPVHYAGHPADMDEINRIAKKHSLTVIEDAAHAVGAEYKERRIGSSGNPTSFSFYATKSMTTGEGGMVTTNDNNLAERLKRLRLHGISSDAWKRYSSKGSWYYEVLEPGFKANMTDMQAALGIQQLKKLDRMIEMRKRHADYYTKAFSALSKSGHIITPTVKSNVRHSWYIYPILVDRLKISRDDFIKALRAENIGTSVHFIPLHLQPFYRDNFGLKRGDFPVTESVYDRLLSIPLFPQMTREDADSVVGAVEKIVAFYKA